MIKAKSKTPPMGWNSWDCYGASVDRKRRVEAMVRSTWAAEFKKIRLGIHRC